MRWVLRRWIMLGQFTTVFLLGPLLVGPDTEICDQVAPLPNVHRFHSRVLSGGAPAGRAGFELLRRWGVRTVISVDGIRPNVEEARRCGLRYVHLPHGYDGISPERARQLARAVRDLPGPIYIHCHHGRHRSPAAAAVACIGAGLQAPGTGTGFLRQAGTSRDYAGLYRDVAAAHSFPAEVLDAVDATFPESVDPPPLVDSMIRLEQHLEHIELLLKRRPVAQPESLAKQTTLLREDFAELLRGEAVAESPEPFLAILERSLQRAELLESSARTMLLEESREFESLKQNLKMLRNDCVSCHRQYRDGPRREKEPRQDDR